MPQPTPRVALAGLASPLQQLQDTLAQLEQDQASRAMQHVQTSVAALADGLSVGSTGSDAAALEEIAQNVGALGFFLDMLGQNAGAARQRFTFDASLGRFRAVPFRKMAAGGSIPLLDEQVSAPATAPSAQPSAVVPPVHAAGVHVNIGFAKHYRHCFCPSRTKSCCVTAKRFGNY